MEIHKIKPLSGSSCISRNGVRLNWEARKFHSRPLPPSAAGGVIASEVGAMDGGEIFFVRDPDGNLLGFQKVPASAPVSSMNFVDNGIGE